jgi:hypothetical protein
MEEDIMAANASLTPDAKSADTEAEPPAAVKMYPRGAAIISADGRYRYRLERHGLSGSGSVAWIMVNPSTADATADDPTIRKVIGFSERMGAGWAIVGNKFAWRATDVRDLRSVSDPVGPGNDEHLSNIMSEAATVIVAWGPLSKLPPVLKRRWYKVARIADRVGARLMCFGTAQDGHPRHPLMLAYDTPLVEWKRPT